VKGQSYSRAEAVYDAPVQRRQLQSVEILLRVEPGQEISILDPLYDAAPVAEEVRRRAKEEGLALDVRTFEGGVAVTRPADSE
jgi:hypothetical protein